MVGVSDRDTATRRNWRLRSAVATPLSTIFVNGAEPFLTFCDSNSLTKETADNCFGS